MAIKRVKAPGEVQSLRNELELTQAQFAEKVGVSKVTVARWESGARECRGKYAQAVGALRSQIPALGRGVSSIWNARADEIGRLDSKRAIEIFRHLLSCLARSAHIPSTAIHVTGRIEVADGGVDASIDTDHALPQESPLGTGRTFFQVKTGNAALPWRLASARKETQNLLYGKTGGVLRSQLSEVGKYVYVHFGADATESQRIKAKNNLKKLFTTAGFTELDVEFWGQNEILELLNDFPSLSLAVKEETEFEFLSHEAWAASVNMSLTLHLGEDQQRFVDDIRAQFRDDAVRHIRVLGEPGIGKTRLVLEALNQQGLAPLVVYVPHAEDFEKSKLFSHLLRVDNPFQAILVIDECRTKSRASIWDALKQRSNRCRLVTIDHGPDLSSDDQMRVMSCPPLAESQITEIITDYVGDSMSVSHWARICEGSPRVAHAVGENLKLHPDDLLKEPSTSDLWERFIARYDDRNSEEVRRRRIVLQHIALFERFGFEDPVSEEADFVYSLIQQNASGIGRADFERIINDLRARRIVQGKVTLFIVPRALQIYLWCAFWDEGGRRVSIPDILQRMPAGLHGWFMAPFRFAANSRVARAKAHDLLRPDGIFSEERFLYSSRGASFLSTLAEVAPQDVINLLEATLAQESCEELHSFDDGRQHIVWAIEKVATCEPKLFCRAAKLLLRLAVAENATHSNNSTGTFTSLFGLAFGSVAPTATPPKDRMPVLRSTLNSSDPRERKIVLDACKVALRNPEHTTRWVGPEYQGLRRVELWMPTTWGELFAAYEDVWSLVRSHWAISEGHERQIAAEVLIEGANFAIQVEALAGGVMTTLEELADDPGAKKALIDLIGRATRFMLDSVDEKILQRLKDLDVRITGESLDSRVRRVVFLSDWDDEFDDNGKRSDSFSARIEALAKEAVKNTSFMSGMIKECILTDGHGVYSFGFYVGKHDEKMGYWPSIRSIIVSPSQRHLTQFTAGYLGAIFEQDKVLWEKTVTELIGNETTPTTVINIILLSGMTKRVMDALLDAVESGIVTTEALNSLHYSSRILDVDLKQVERVVEALSQCENETATETALCVIERVYCREDETPPPLPKMLTAKVLTLDAAFTDKKTQMLPYHWAKVAKAYIGQFPDEAKVLFAAVLSRLSDWRMSIRMEDYYNDTLLQIAADAPDACWEIVSNHLTDLESPLALGIRHWLREKPSFGDRRGRKRPITIFNVNTVLDWVAKDPRRRAAYIAELTPKTLDRNDDGELTYELLSKYGDIDRVASSLWCNFRSGGFSGPASEYWRKRQTEARSWLAETSDPNVVPWLQDYLDSLQREIERSEIEEERRF